MTTADGGPDALARATRALQEQDEPGWSEVSDRVRRRLRTVSRPGRPLMVHDSGAGTIRVDERVVVDTVRRAVAQVPGCRPVAVAAHADVQVLASLRLAVWASYGTDVRAVAAAARGAAAGAVVEVLGRGCPVDVAVVDIDPARPGPV